MMMSGKRISREMMFAQMLQVISNRSTCDRKKVGALIELEGRILTMGYNGAPSGLPHCHDAGCLIDGKTNGCIRTQHAEANAIAFAAKQGISIKGATLWTSLAPCLSCAKLIINSGIAELVYLEGYRDTSGIELLRQVPIPTRLFY